MSKHLITPPPELLEQWEAEVAHTTLDELSHVATQAARWGADQELEACCEWIRDNYWFFVRCPDGQKRHLAVVLEMDRRPEPPSLKSQALEALDQADKGLNESEWQQRSDTIRRALESLSDV